ncbi:MAG: hypothetical protein HZLCBSQH_001936 [Candidatus Fervidibacterota bacterium]
MCFQNLPIEFDEQGRPRLKSGVRDPYAYRRVSLAEQEEKLRGINGAGRLHPFVGF